MKTILTAWLVLVFSAAFAQSFSNGGALRGIQRVKVIFDVNVADPETLLNRMELLDTTYSQLVDSGASPTVVVAFRGKASRYITRGDRYVAAGQRKYKREMKQWIELFSELGFTVEQCAIAARSNNIDTGDFLPQVKVVANGYISLIGYQQQGYAFLPMD